MSNQILSDTAVRLVPLVERKKPGHRSSKERAFNRTLYLVPGKPAVPQRGKDHIQRGVGDNPRKPESPRWFVFHCGPLIVRREEGRSSLGATGEVNFAEPL